MPHSRRHRHLSTGRDEKFGWRRHERSSLTWWNTIIPSISVLGLHGWSPAVRIGARRVAPSPRYPRARTENNGQLRSLLDSNENKNFWLEQDFCSNWLTRATRAKLPGSAWQSRGQGFESSYLHRVSAGQAVAGASGPSRLPKFPCPRESGVTSVNVKFRFMLSTVAPATGGHSAPTPGSRLVSDGETTGRLQNDPTVGRPGPVPVKTAPAPAAIVGARNAHPFPLPIRRNHMMGPFGLRMSSGSLWWAIAVSSSNRGPASGPILALNPRRVPISRLHVKSVTKRILFESSGEFRGLLGAFDPRAFEGADA